MNDLADIGAITSTDEVRDALLALAAIEAEDAEVAETRKAAARLRLMAFRQGEAPSKNAFKQRIFGPQFRAGAGPGPSGIRNSHITELARLP